MCRFKSIHWFEEGRVVQITKSTGFSAAPMVLMPINRLLLLSEEILGTLGVIDSMLRAEQKHNFQLQTRSEVRTPVRPVSIIVIGAQPANYVYSCMHTKSVYVMCKVCMYIQPPTKDKIARNNDRQQLW